MDSNDSLAFNWADPSAFMHESVPVVDTGGLKCDMETYEARYNSQENG